MRLSIVTTLYRSAGYIDEFHRRACAAAATLTDDFEVVYVNDGSPDDSLSKVISLCDSDPRVRVVDLSRNFGHHKAMMTGLNYAQGEQVFLIDCDLEEDPAWLANFAEQLSGNHCDVVYGVQAQRKGDVGEQASGDLFYRLFNLISDTQIPKNLVTARLMTQRYVKALLEHQEREVFLAGLLAITGFKQVPITVHKLSTSPSTYGLRRKLSLLVNSITSFSASPLRFFFYAGAAILAVSLLSVLIMVIRALAFDSYASGWASLMVSVWFLGGLIVFGIGVLGIYLSKIFIETKQRPYTVVRHVYGETENNGPDNACMEPQR